MLPRFQGRVGKGDDNKFYFEIFMSIIGDGKEPQSLGTFGPWDTEDIAHAELMNAAKICCEQAGGEPGKYIDMKDNKTKEFPKC
jgi:hypothetical protein